MVELVYYFLSHRKLKRHVSLIKNILSLPFNEVLLLVMLNRLRFSNSMSITGDDVTQRLLFPIPGSCTMSSSLKVNREPSDEAEPKPF